MENKDVVYSDLIAYVKAKYLIGCSRPINEVRIVANKVARPDSTVITKMDIPGYNDPVCESSIYDSSRVFHITEPIGNYKRYSKENSFIPKNH